MAKTKPFGKIGKVQEDKSVLLVVDVIQEPKPQEPLLKRLLKR